MMFHDMRSKPDMENALEVVKENFLEIEKVEINVNYSNMMKLFVLVLIYSIKLKKND